VEVLIGELLEKHPFLTPAHPRRLVRSYGTRAFAMMEGVQGMNDLGEVFVHDLTAREVDYPMDQAKGRRMCCSDAPSSICTRRRIMRRGSRRI